jgi:hypothetical protein
MEVKHTYLGDGGEIEFQEITAEQVKEITRRFIEINGLPAQSSTLCIRGIKVFPMPENCGGCGYSFAEIEAGDAEHGCDCGAKLTALECYEQNGTCMKCMLLD